MSGNISWVSLDIYANAAAQQTTATGVDGGGAAAAVAAILALTDLVRRVVTILQQSHGPLFSP